jgi:hypothetical protein
MPVGRSSTSNPPLYLLMKRQPFASPAPTQAETIDAFGHRWRSTATATADAKGTVELADPNTLIWSMRFDSPKATPDLFIPPAEPTVTLVMAGADGKRSHGTLVRRTAAPGIDVQEVRASGVVLGCFFHPALLRCPGPYCSPDLKAGWTPRGRNAELLASHGCAALVAATFAGDGPLIVDLPLRLERVPLERFADAIRWLADHDRVDASRVTAMAISRGSEGLLATVSRIADLPLRSIVAISPSSATWVGLGENGSLVDIPAWTLRGDDLPAVQTDDQAVLAEIARQAFRRRGRRTRFGPALLELSRRVYPEARRPRDDWCGRYRVRADWSAAVSCRWGSRRRVAVRRNGQAPTRSTPSGAGDGGSKRSAAHLSRCRPLDPARLLADDRNPLRIDRARRHASRSSRRPGRPNATDHSRHQLLIFEAVKSR